MRRTWHVLGTLALSLAAGCEPSRGWVEVGLREDALLEAPPPALLDTPMARAALAPLPAREPAVEAWRRAPRADTALELARSYFPGLPAAGGDGPPLDPAVALQVTAAPEAGGPMQLATR